MRADLDPEIAIEEKLKKRARRQRRWLTVGALWVLSWSCLMVEHLLLYTEWTSGLLTAAIFALVVSIPALVLILPIAMIGRYLGNFGRLKPYRYHLAIGLPLLGCIALNIPTALDRIWPQRRFEKVTAVALPSNSLITNYRSSSYGLDSSFSIEFKSNTTDLVDLLKQLECLDDGFTDYRSTKPKEEYDIGELEGQVGVLKKMKIDWSNSTAVFEFLSY